LSIVICILIIERQKPRSPESASGGRDENEREYSISAERLLEKGEIASPPSVDRNDNLYRRFQEIVFGQIPDSMFI
jgi:hypothetical protein